VAWSFGGLLGSNESKTAGTSLAVTISSTNLVVGDLVVVGFGADDTALAPSVTDTGTAAITWQTVSEGQVGLQGVMASCLEGQVTVAGTITGVTVSWTGSTTAKAAVVGYWHDVAFPFHTVGLSTRNQASASSQVCIQGDDGVNWSNGDLLVGVCGWEGPNGDVLGASSAGDVSGATEVGQNGTIGGGAAGNASVCLIYGTATAAGASTDQLIATSDNARSTSGCGASYGSAAAAAEVFHEPILALQAVKRSNVY
jgi:hypothetical protein